MLYSTVLGRGGGAPGGSGRASIQSNPGGATGFSLREKLGGLERFDKLEVDDLASTLDSQSQGQGKGHLGPGVESLSRGDRDSRAA